MLKSVNVLSKKMKKNSTLLILVAFSNATEEEKEKKKRGENTKEIKRIDVMIIGRVSGTHLISSLYKCVCIDNTGV